MKLARLRLGYVPLTDAASIAVDPKFTPLGSPVYLATTRPDTGAVMNRLVQVAKIADQLGNTAARDKMIGTVKTRLENWLKARLQTNNVEINTQIKN